MTDLDSELPGRLAALAERIPVTDMVERSVRHGHRIRMKRRSALGAVGVAVLVGAVVVPLSLRGSSGPAGSLRVGSGHGVVNAQPLLSSKRQDESFDVGASGGFLSDGGIPPPWSACPLATIRAGASLRATRYGEAGVVTLVAARCKLDYHLTVVGLVDSSGNLLSVPLAGDPDSTNLPGSTGEATEYGKAIAGFSWSGSWCGPPAAAVRVRMGPGYLDVPLTGPQPTCQGTSNSQLVAGVIGNIGQAVQPPPAAWADLSINFAIGPNLTHSALSGMAITFQNSTSVPIYLSPTPTYILDYQDVHGDGSSTGGVVLTRPGQQLVVRARSTLTVHLPDTPVSVRDTFAPNSTITVLVTIAGMPSARAQTVVRCASQTVQGRVTCQGPFVN